MTPADEAVKLFKGGYNCAQALAMTFGGRFGLSRDLAITLGRGFGGGVGEMGRICGAVNGAALLMGFAGSGHLREASSQNKTYELVREFTRRFEERHCGTSRCRELLGVDPDPETGAIPSVTRQQFRDTCLCAVRDAAELLEEMLPKEAPTWRSRSPWGL